MSARSRSLLAAAALAGGLAATAARAQTPAPASASAAAAAPLDSSPTAHGSAALIGRVHTPDNTMLADVELTVLGDDAHGRSVDGRSARTGPGGTFRLDSITPGRYFVRVRRLGFAPLYFSATLDGGAPRRIDVELAPLAARLAEVDVRGESGYSGFAEKRLRDFEFRRRAGFGRFFTRDDLKNYRGWSLSDAISYIAWGTPRHFDYAAFLPLGTGLGGCGRDGREFGVGAGPFGRAAQGWDGGRTSFVRCVSIDGTAPISADLAINLPVNSIEALEVYGSLIVVWTGSESSD